MGLTRQCTRTGCKRRAVATLTYVYSDQTAVLGPLATFAEPHTYDLCAGHARRLTAPRGWQVQRLAVDLEEPTGDELLALADLVREASGRQEQSEDLGGWPIPEPPSPPADGPPGGRRPSLRVLRDG